ncbi:ATP-grasp fold amidoligase family protein [Tenacibaculum ovolyticum]|uniref:ATP-grasp fold amidoligase family protein n=1 Tax=Tenacibaculum ovolyticum TaxID=104270 RepID=UPI0005BA52C7|nr:ATP-grasp fold amidoligase family protein [Tenacibaculum ovolyticum]
MMKNIIKLLVSMSDKNFIKLKYFIKFKRRLNLIEPRTFNEKLQWLKINDRTELHTKCADKFLVREYIKKQIGEKYLVPLIFSTKNVKEISPEKLPDFPFIIKTNHDSGTYFIVRNKSEVDWVKVRKKLKKALSLNYYYQGREWQYKNITPCIIVEKLLYTDNGKVPQDLKFHCFNGGVKFIQVDIDRETNHRRSLFDKDWNLLDFGLHYPRGNVVEKPKRINDLIELVEKLSENFHFVRIDFYELDSMIYFGEITFHPGSGFEKFDPKNKDLEYGNVLKLE